MARSDFNLVKIGHTFTEASPTITKQFRVEGNQVPVDDAYLLIQVRSVASSSHRIRINNVDLPSFDLPPAPGNSQAWLMWMDHVPPNTLQSGMNSITITRSGNDNFEVGDVVVNWREPG